MEGDETMKDAIGMERTLGFLRRMIEGERLSVIGLLEEDETIAPTA